MMILFVNQTTGEVEDGNSANTIPIEINTNVKLLISDKKNNYIENDKLKYISGDNVVLEKYHAVRNNIQEEVDLSNVTFIGCNHTDINERLYKGELVPNDKVTIPCKKYDILEVDEINSIGLYIDDIMEKEFYNILEASEYDKSSYYILEDVVLPISKFISYNRFRVLMNPSDHITLRVPDVKASKVIKIIGIDEVANVIVNNNSALYIDDGFYTNVASTEAYIEIVNTSDKIIEIKNPYILYS